MASLFLTKSKFAAGIQCEKRLWLEANRPERGKPTSPAQQRLFDLGREVGRLARTHISDGVLIEGEGFRDALGQTEHALREGADVLYEATFASDDLGAKIDLLRRISADSWELVEVKMSTSVKDEHIPDVAFQREVMERAGLHVERTTLMHINNECVYPDLDDLFEAADITDRVDDFSATLSARIDRLLGALDQRTEPAVPIGSHCDKPHECPFKGYCWVDVPEMHSIFSVPRIPGDVVDELVPQGILHAVNIPDDHLTPARREYVELVRGGEPRIAEPEIRQMLGELKHPIHFFDFESINDPIPRFDGTRPYQQVPFQFSCHTLHPNGELVHRGYLHTASDDPRRPIAEALVDALGRVGSVVVYHKHFEAGILKDLAEHLPALKAELLAIVDRLWDLLPVFRKHYAHPAFNGSNSIKNVLPVLVTDLNYDGLDVADGTAAQVAWRAMLSAAEEGERGRYAEALRDYCRLDTLAMVRLMEHVQDLVQR